MPKLQISKSHQLSLEEAKVRVRKLVEDAFGQYQRHINTIDWASDGCSARVKGSLFKGTFQVTASAVDVNLDFSFLASPFMGKIRTRIEERVNNGFAET